MRGNSKKNEKNIGIVCDYSSVYSGNFISSILALGLKLGENNQITFLFPIKARTRKWINEFSKHNFNVVYFRERKKDFIYDVKKAYKIYSLNLIYFHFVSPVLGKMALLFKSVDLCFHIHSDFNGGKPARITTRIKLFIFDKFIKRKSVYIFVSEDLFKHSHATIKYYIPNALARAGSLAKKSIIYDEKLEIPHFNESLPVFLAFAWSPYIKGIDVLCKAFNIFNSKINSALLLVHRKENGKDELISFLNNNHIDMTNIYLLPPAEDVAMYYSLCSCFVSSSRSEGFSYSVLEAIFLKKNVIISNIPGTKWAKNFKYVYEYECENIQSLEKIMEQASVIKRNPLDEMFNAELLKKYDISIWIEKICSAFERQKILYEEKTI